MYSVQRKGLRKLAERFGLPEDFPLFAVCLRNPES
jgi:hypothetical protein